MKIEDVYTEIDSLIIKIINSKSESQINLLRYKLDILKDYAYFLRDM